MKIILKNLFSLGLIHSVNLLVPLLITPYLIKTVGISSFGVIATAQSIVVFFNILTDFGFNLSSVRRIAQAQGNVEQIEKIINGVVFLKLILLSISFILFVVLVTVVPQFNKHLELYLFSFSIVIGQACLPLWFYQGIEKINITIIPVIISKLLTIAAIFFFIKSESNSPLVNIFFGIGNIIAGLYLFGIMRKEYKISFKLINLNILSVEFKNGFAMFTSNVAVVIHANSSLIILSFFLTPLSLGIYSVVDKIVQILKGILSLVHQAFYPRICNIVKESDNALFNFIKKIYGIVWSIVLLVCLILFFFSNLIVSYFIKEPQSIIFAGNLLHYLSFILLITSLNMPFYQSLLAYNKDWLAVRILFVAAVLSLLLSLILIPLFKINGAIINIYIIETLITLTFIHYFSTFKKKYG